MFNDDDNLRDIGQTEMKRLLIVVDSDVLMLLLAGLFSLPL